VVLKKNSFRSHQIVVLFYVFKMIEKMMANFQHEKKVLYERKMRLFSCLRTCVLWRKRMARYGKDKILNLNRNKVRFAMTILAVNQN